MVRRPPPPDTAGEGPAKYYSGAEAFRHGEPSRVQYPEQTWFKSGDQLLGYLEGRPGASRLVSVEAWKPAHDWQRAPTAERKITEEARERIEKLPQVQEAPKGERAALVREYVDAWEECDDGGAFVEVEIDYGNGE